MRLESTISAGDKAPDFSLPSTQGEINLFSLLAGKRVVLAFYTEDNTPTCSRELSTFKADYDLFQELNANMGLPRSHGHL
ncbi:MAG: redoxin domain-containing protein [Dehalococcoidia bacterium]|nr:redoxin domain-containing protein [Dehalococcoidia bacterium]